MTEKEGLYYCDICHDKNPIPKMTGFSFPINPLGIEHAHQECYFAKQAETKEILEKDASRAFMKVKGIDLSITDVNNIVDSNIQHAKDMIEKYKRGEYK